jgi:hypothetical protein
LEELRLDETIKLLKKLRQPKFLLDGKYKAHKICAFKVFRMILDINAKKIAEELLDLDLEEFAGEESKSPPNKLNREFKFIYKELANQLLSSMKSTGMSEASS